jgi:O-antigen/teichoic acid export membrane protein
MSFRRLALAVINLVGIRMGGAMIGLFSQILLARLLPPSEVGAVFLAMSVAAMVSLIATAGYAPLALTVVPRYLALGRRGLLQAFRAAYWRDASAAMMVTTLAIAGAVLFLPLDAVWRMALLAGLIAAPGLAFIRMNGAIANSMRRYHMSYVPDFLLRPGILFAFLGLALLFQFHVSAFAVLAVFIASGVVVAGFQALLLGGDGIFSGLSRGTGRALSPYLCKRAVALIFVALVAGAFADLVIFIGGFFLKPDDLALLGVCVRLAALAGFVAQATQSVILPDLAATLTRGDKGNLRRLLLRSNVVVMTVLILAILAAAALGPLALGVFGADYVGGRWLLVLFMVSQFFRGLGGINQHLLSFAGKQVRTAWSCLGAVLVLGASALLLVPYLGIAGMGWAAIAADLTWAILLAHAAARAAGRRGDILAVMLPTKS